MNSIKMCYAADVDKDSVTSNLPLHLPTVSHGVDIMRQNVFNVHI